MLISASDYLYFASRALDGMTAVLAELGDELANRRPDLPGANSAYAIVTHCLGVLDFWVGFQVAGRPVERDRDAEFTASGHVDDLVARIHRAQRQLRVDVLVANPAGPMKGEVPASYLATRPDLSQSGALLHAYEELAQHHGQIQITRDLLLAANPVLPRTDARG